MENYSYSSYPESGDSSPRSREIDFENPPPWDVDQANSQAQNYKVKFMCSYGGKILPRPHDNQLCYVGGETKILAVDRGTKFAALVSKLSSLSENDVSFKYQLPGEDLDALISVTNDDDLEHMMHEYDRVYRTTARPVRMRLFLFNASPDGGFGSDGGRSDRDRFVEALNSSPAQGPDSNSKPPVQNNVDFLFGLEKGGVPAVVPPPPPAVPTVPEHVAPPPEFQVRSGHGDRVIGSDPVEFQRHLQRLQIAEQDHQQAMYRRQVDENIVGGYGGGAGDYYVQKLPEKAPPVTVGPPAGYWAEKQVPSVGFPGTAPPEQPMYMITATTGSGAMYHAPPPMVRPVTGPPGQGYYHMQPRMGSEVYREQPVYNVIPQPQQPQQQQQPSTLPPQPQPSTQPPQPPKYVATYAEAPPYTQMAYDSVTGRQVYYTAPGGGVMQPPQQQQSYQAMGPPAVGGELRVAGGLSQEGNVISFFLFTSPFPTFVKIIKQKSVGEFKADPYVATLLNCAMWCFYGMPFVHPDSVLVITINGCGFVIELIYIAIFLTYSSNAKRRRILIALLVEVIFFAVVVFVTLHFFHTTKGRSMIIGILCIVCNIIMYASPLTIVKMVIKTKSVKYMPFTLSLANLCNGIVWLIYALIKFDPYILVPNGLGSISGLVQLILYATYYKTTNWDEEDEKPKSEVQLSNV